MAGIVVAISNVSLREKISGIFEKNGVRVGLSCRTGAEAIRYINRAGGGVIVCTPHLVDMTADMLCDSLGKSAFFLVIGKADELNFCENETVFKRSLPTSGAELCGSVRILIELDSRRGHDHKPYRSKEENDLIIRAKELVMAQNNFTEDQAYRFLQKQSMETSTPLVEVAKIFIKELDSVNF